MHKGLISLKKAEIKDGNLAISIDYNLSSIEHIEQNRKSKITKAIKNSECYLILESENTVGFILFDYRFFDLGWIELIIIDEEYRGKGIGTEAIKLICELSKTKKVFTSTNKSNTRMQKALDKAGFKYAGEIVGLDEGDPELFYFITQN